MRLFARPIAQNPTTGSSDLSADTSQRQPGSRQPRDISIVIVATYATLGAITGIGAGVVVSRLGVIVFQTQLNPADLKLSRNAVAERSAR